MAAGYTLSSADMAYQAQRLANYWKALLPATQSFVQRLVDIGNAAISAAYQAGGSPTYAQDLVDLGNATVAMNNIINYAGHVGTVTLTDNTGGAGLADPTVAPSVTPQGVVGATTSYYQVIAHTLNGTTTGYTGTPPAAVVGATTTGNAALSSSNYNLIAGYSQYGATLYDILWWNGSAWRLKATTTATSFQDTGQADSAYSVPTSNTTAGTTRTVSVPNGSCCVVTADPILVAMLKPVGADQTPAIRKMSDLTSGTL